MIYKLFVIIIIYFLCRDLIYRLFFIYPKVNAPFTGAGNYAARIEQWDVLRWLIPAIRNENDIIFVGNSHVMDGINPRIVFEYTGLKGVNLAFYSHSSLNSLQLLFMYGRYPRYILIDVSTRYAIFHNELRLSELADKYKYTSRFKDLYLNCFDSLSWFFPSLVIPKPYRWILMRSIKKFTYYRKNRRVPYGRYTPFGRICSYEWRLDKSTNHRMAKKIREKSSYEKRSEKYFISRAIVESFTKCGFLSKEYALTKKEYVSAIKTLMNYHVEIIFMRMPLERRIIDYENNYLAQYFDDIKILCNQYDLQYWDLNSARYGPEEKLEFYCDGQHLYAHSADVLSKHLSKLITAHIKNQ